MAAMAIGQIETAAGKFPIEGVCTQNGSRFDIIVFCGVVEDCVNKNGVVCLRTGKLCAESKRKLSAT